MLAYHKQIDKRTTMKNHNRSAALGQPVMKYHKLRKTFSKFYRRHFDIVSKYNVGLKTLLQGLSEPEFMAPWCINSE